MSTKIRRTRLVSLLTKLLKYKLASTIGGLFSYGRAWDLLAMTKSSAMDGISGFRNEQGFDRWGATVAEKLGSYISHDDIVLDIGCGIGKIDKHLAAYCAELHAVDVSKRMVKLARSRLKGISNIYI